MTTKKQTTTTTSFNIGSYNVVFVVVDSCRYDTAMRAHTPFLCELSILRRAEAPATYTLPSHISFFSGILPNLIDGNPEYIPGFRQIWRSNNAKPTDKSVTIQFQGKNIIDYYELNGYNVIGAGGVSFFSSKKGNMLPALFPRFIHFDKPKGLSREHNLPRSIDQFPLGNIELLSASTHGKDPFFLFINCPETHIPFDCPNVIVNSEYKNAIAKMYAVDGIKHRKVKSSEGLTIRERAILLNAQQKSLEWVDAQLRLLLNRLCNSRPTLMLVMGDHGEEFGEAGRYGHAHNHTSVMHVPFWGGVL